MRPGRPILWFERSYGSLVSKIRISKIRAEIRSPGAVLLVAGCSLAATGAKTVLVRDITTVAGVRDNPLVGYSIVVGLNGTGDRRQTLFTTQTLANIMQRMGVQIPANQVRVNNVAAVFVTASLPPFARPGMSLDVTVSSIGDAKSLEGGVLLLAPLHGPDGQVYAEAQGPLTLGGFTAGGSGNTKQSNHPTVGRIPNGGTVERDTAVDLNRLTTVSFVLRDADFTAAREISTVINQPVQQDDLHRHRQPSDQREYRQLRYVIGPGADFTDSESLDQRSSSGKSRSQRAHRHDCHGRRRQAFPGLGPARHPDGGSDNQVRRLAT